MPQLKPVVKASPARRSLDEMVVYAFESGAVASAEDLFAQVSLVQERKLYTALLAILQLPHARLLHTASEWESRWSRRPRPGERPLVLLFPFAPVEFVFDVSQTEPTGEGLPLPFDPEPFAMRGFSDAPDILARLERAVAPLGVRIVPSRLGVAMAGCIEAVEHAGVLQVASEKDGTREVPVRWVVHLNGSHEPTERLATLTHELGHLFCGHVGAETGDWWPNRPCGDRVQREFEAESVARLAFGRLAPDLTLPAYLEHILEPGDPIPDSGWSHVAKAAEHVIEIAEKARRFA